MIEFNEFMQGLVKGLIGYKPCTSCLIVFNEQNGCILKEAANQRCSAFDINSGFKIPDKLTNFYAVNCQSKVASLKYTSLYTLLSLNEK